MFKLILLSLLWSLPALAGDRVIINPDSDGDLKLKVNKSAGGVTDAMVVTGSSADVAFGATTGQARIDSTAGSAATPTFSFAGDTDTGLYRSTADEISIATAGTLKLTVSNGGEVRGVNGSGASPAYSFLNATSSGMSWDAANTRTQISSEGTVRMRFDTVNESTTDLVVPVIYTGKQSTSIGDGVTDGLFTPSSDTIWKVYVLFSGSTGFVLQCTVSKDDSGDVSIIQTYSGGTQQGECYEAAGQVRLRNMVGNMGTVTYHASWTRVY